MAFISFPHINLDKIQYLWGKFLLPVDLFSELQTYMTYTLNGLVFLKYHLQFQLVTDKKKEGANLTIIQSNGRQVGKVR